MFRNKPTPADTKGSQAERMRPGVGSRRNVRRPEHVNVFSYYAKRSPSDDVQIEQPAANKSRILLSWLRHAPSFVALAVVAVCLIFCSTLSTTPKIQVVGRPTDRTLIRGIAAYQGDIQAVLERSITNRSKLLIDTNKVAQELGEEFPELGDISVVLPLVSRRPIVQVRPAAPALVLGSGSGAFIIDQEGRAVVKADEVESSVKDALPVVSDESGLPVEPGKNALPKETVDFITTVTLQLGLQNIPVQSLTLPATANELHLRIKDKPYFVKFDVRGQGRQQAGTFLAVKEQLEKDRKVPAEYIDVRVPEKAFYR